MAPVSQPSPLAAARQQAQALAGSGDPAGARVVLENAVAMGRFTLGKDHPEVLATARELAQLLLAADDPSTARRVLEEAYADGQWRYGDADPVIVLISHDLGVVAEELGNRLEARKAFTRVAEHGTAVLGRDHWAVSRANAYLGAPVQPGTVRIELPPPPPFATPPATTEPAYREPQPPLTAPTGPADDEPATPTHDDQAPASPQTWASEPTQLLPATEPPSHPAPDLNPAPLHQQPPAYPQAPSRELAFYPAPANLPVPFDAPWEGGRGGPAEPVEQGYGLQHRLSAPPAATMMVHEQDRSAYARKAPALFAVIAAVLAAVIAVVALIVVLAMRSDKPDDPQVPTLGGGPAPTDVKVAPSGSSIKVTWTDPANGTTTFIVSGGHPGEVLKPMGQVSLGVTTLTLNGLNPDLSYCFTVVAVYSSTEFATSPQVCTGGKGTPRPSTT
jgi:hypothetical protein